VALAYLPIAAAIHSHANEWTGFEWVDFPLLAVPWPVLLGLAITGGIRALRDNEAVHPGRIPGAIGLVVSSVQLGAGLILAIRTITDCFFCL
jgi:hypothetical protein